MYTRIMRNRRLLRRHPTFVHTNRTETCLLGRNVVVVHALRNAAYVHDVVRFFSMNESCKGDIMCDIQRSPCPLSLTAVVSVVDDLE